MQENVENCRSLNRRATPRASLLLCLVWVPIWVFGAAQIPPAAMSCVEKQDPAWGAWLGQTLCYFPPHISKFTHPLNDEGNYAGILHPIPLPGNGSLKLVSHFDGWGNGQFGADPSYAREDAIVIRNDYDNAYLTEEDRAALGVSMPQDWGIALITGDPSRPCSSGHCEAGNYRFGAAIRKAHKLFGSSIDKGAGITLEGNCYGATAIHMLPLVLRDEKFREQITVIDAHSPGNLFVRNAGSGEMNEFGTTKKAGLYWQDESIRKSWGDFDIARVDLLLPENQKKIAGVYFHAHNGSNDYLGFSLDFFREVCDKGKIACYGWWYISDHVGVEAGLNYDPRKIYSGPDMSARLDSMLPVFTHSTANNWGPRGHYNLGLEWKNAGFVDTATRAEIPIRYVRRTNLGLEIADQPLAATFDLTIRRFKNFDLPTGTVVHWTVGSTYTTQQSGKVVTTVAGEVTIPKITRHSSAQYEPVILTKE
jgi:hypothetical protein